MIVLVRVQKIIFEKRAQLMLGFLLLIIGCDKSKNLLVVEGNTMGTTYTVKIVDDVEKLNSIEIKNIIDSVLVIVNKQMSTWDPNSEISKFNRWQSVSPFKVSDPFYEVVKSAINISEKTNGMFDVTVYDLMSLWGFGPNPKSGIPDKNSIESLLFYTGYKNIKCDQGMIIKTNPRTKLDLNSIAKGYGVDNVYENLKNIGFENIFVEIGGELRFSGVNEKNRMWSVGLENPPSDISNSQVPFFGILKNNSCAIATSANYRNIVDIEGTILGHTINPITGFPIQTDVLSVTVIAEKCMTADAWATVLMTLDYASGLELLQKNSGINAIWIVQDSDGNRSIVVHGSCSVLDPIFPIK